MFDCGRPSCRYRAETCVVIGNYYSLHANGAWKERLQCVVSAIVFVALATVIIKSGLSTRIFQAAPTMSHAAPTMGHAAHFADNFPTPWRLKRLLTAPKRLLGAAGAALLKAWVLVIVDILASPSTPLSGGSTSKY
jgi:hypothetical protein